MITSVQNGAGFAGSATTTPQSWKPNSENIHFYPNRVRIYNTGSQYVKVRINISLSDFIATSSLAMTIPPTKDEWLVTDGRPPIMNVVFATETGSSYIIINAL